MLQNAEKEQVLQEQTFYLPSTGIDICIRKTNFIMDLCRPKYSKIKLNISYTIS